MFAGDKRSGSYKTRRTVGTTRWLRRPRDWRHEYAGFVRVVTVMQTSPLRIINHFGAEEALEAAVKPRASGQKVQVNNQSRAGQPMDQTGGKNSSPAVSLQYESIAPSCPAKERAEFLKHCQQISEQSSVEVPGSTFTDKTIICRW